MSSAMVFRVYTPAAPLNRFVKNFWLYRGYRSPHRRERILQDATFKTVFNLDQDEFRIYDAWRPDTFSRYSGALVSRPSAVPFVTDSTEEAHILGVNFTLTGALPLLGFAANAEGPCHVELKEIWGRRVLELHERLTEASGPDEQFRLLENALLPRLRHGPRHHPAVAAAMNALSATPAAHTRRVAADVALSQRRLITLFKREIGITPKLFSRVRRFQHVLTALRDRHVPEWSSLALNYGYCDQSHMIRDFTAFAGFSPSEYLRAMRRCAEQGVRVKHNHVCLFD